MTLVKFKNSAVICIILFYGAQETCVVIPADGGPFNSTWTGFDAWRALFKIAFLGVLPINITKDILVFYFLYQFTKEFHLYSTLCETYK